MKKKNEINELKEIYIPPEKRKETREKRHIIDD